MLSVESMKEYLSECLDDFWLVCDGENCMIELVTESGNEHAFINFDEHGFEVRFHGMQSLAWVDTDWKERAGEIVDAMDFMYSLEEV